MGTHAPKISLANLPFELKKMNFRRADNLFGVTVIESFIINIKAYARCQRAIRTA